MELKIDEEFRDLLPKLSGEEYLRLETQIKKDGVLSPIITWNGIIIDGHNRYQICKLNGITDFPTKEMKFEDRDGVIEWILSHQLGRRNLSDFQRTEIALRYEQVIARKAKERQGKRNDLITSGSIEPKVATDSHYTRKEVAKIAETSPSTVMRTKFIIENGTDEQKERARKGGKEVDGKSNSITAIVQEIKDKKSEESGTKMCPECGKIKPIEFFCLDKRTGWRNKYCNTCRHTKFNKDTLGNSIKSIETNIDAEEFVRNLYDSEKQIDYTVDDLLEEVTENGKRQ